MLRLVPSVVVLAMLAACGGPTQMANVRDVRVAIPAADPKFIDVVTPEMMIEAGSDKMFCSKISYDGDNVAFTKVDGYQGKFGHHVVLLAASEDDTHAAGEVFDCTKMTNFKPFAIPMDGVPPGYGTALDHGKQLMVQTHYLNTSQQTLLIRDVIRLTKVDLASVTTWSSVYATSQLGFQVPPNAVNNSVTFDCTIPMDLELIALGGHMHEYGSYFKSLIGPDADHLETLYSVDTWQAAYRDSPPVTLYVDNPKKLKAGTLVRTTCAWTNTTDHKLEFPEEMCATFGAVGGTRDPVVCTDGMIPQ